MFILITRFLFIENSVINLILQKKNNTFLTGFMFSFTEKVHTHNLTDLSLKVQETVCQFWQCNNEISVKFHVHNHNLDVASDIPETVYHSCGVIMKLQSRHTGIPCIR